MSVRPLETMPDDREDGFSLIELLVGLALLAAAATMATPLLRSAFEPQALRSSATELASTARSARAAAVRSGAEQAFLIDTSSGRYWVEGSVAPRAPNTACRAGCQPANPPRNSVETQSRSRR